MTEVSSWLGKTGIGGIIVAVPGMHDGYAEVYVETALSSTGEKRLREHLIGKIKGIQDVTVFGTTIKIIAMKHDGKVLTEPQLKKLANSAIKSIQTWADSMDGGDLTFIVSQHNRQREFEAMATNSSVSSYGAGENDNSTF